MGAYSALRFGAVVSQPLRSRVALTIKRMEIRGFI
jgi:hypothetical protein